MEERIMKKYIKPVIEVVAVKNITLLTTSTVGVSDTPYDGTFDGRSNDGDDW